MAALTGCDNRDAVDKALDNVDPERLAAFKRGLEKGERALGVPTATPDPDTQALEDAIARGVEKGIKEALGG